MAIFNKWIWNFVSPSYGAEAGLFGGFAMTDFIIDIPMGRVSDGGVDRHSCVLASICELAAAPGHPFDFPFIGAASMEVRNIAPRDDGIVSLWIHIDWAAPLHIRLNLLVIND
jgi:hypothetical protein